VLLIFHEFLFLFLLLLPSFLSMTELLFRGGKRGKVQMDILRYFLLLLLLLTFFNKF
jgi:hypothetical protein